MSRRRNEQVLDREEKVFSHAGKIDKIFLTSIILFLFLIFAGGIILYVNYSGDNNSPDPPDENKSPAAQNENELYKLTPQDVKDGLKESDFVMEETRFLFWVICALGIIAFVIAMIFLVIHFMYIPRKAIYNYQELREWIKRERKAGATDEEIQEIIKANSDWKDKDIEKALMSRSFLKRGLRFLALNLSKKNESEVEKKAEEPVQKPVKKIGKGKKAVRKVNSGRKKKGKR
jgi:hypothetical protein